MIPADAPPPSAAVIAAEAWVRDLSLNGETYRRDQLDFRWNGPDGRRHRETLQDKAPALLQATVAHVRALLANLPA